ncbi:MAG: SpoIIE family protein phosphatase [Candidatus Acidiferrales bacterium]
MAPRKPATLQYICLSILFVFACAYQIRAAYFYFPEFFGSEAVGWPFIPAYSHGQPLAMFLLPEALDAGLKENDAIISVNGHSFTGESVFGDAIAHAKPGETMNVVVRRPNEPAARDITITLRPHRHYLSPVGMVLIIALRIVLPVFCILLGFWVAAVRPRDPSAWFLLPVLLGLATMYGVGIESWGPGIRDVAQGFRTAVSAAWPLSMMLFGIYFPEKLTKYPGPLWWRWSKKIVVAALLVMVAVAIVINIGELENYSAIAGLEAIWDKLQPVILALDIFACSSFFISMSLKSRAAPSPDVKRRFNLIYIGATVATTPLFILTMIQAVKGGAQLEKIFPEWIVLGSLIILMILPVTLAYVIVVQRAMDVRVVIRQGLQYALARRGVLVLQIILTSIIITAAITLEGSTQRSKPQKMIIISLCFVAILWLRKLAVFVRAWVDRRFFRDAYNAEQILAGLSDEVRTLVETKPLLERVAQRIAESLHVPRVAVLLEDGGCYKPAYALGYASDLDATLAESSTTIQRLRHDSEPARVYLDDEKSWVNSSAVAADERRKIASLEPQLLLPLSTKEKLLGLIALGEKRSEEPYSGSDLRLLKSVAAQTGLALANAQLTATIAEEVGRREKMNREIEIAREVQERLFPQRLPQVAGLDYCGRCRTALGVGGDYYDFLALPEGMLGVALGDISGKGIPAALMMASLQASLRAEAMRARNEIAELMSRVNQALFEASSEDRYATFFYAQLDPATRCLTYVNGGHCAPMLFRADGDGKIERLRTCKIERLDTGGPVVGLIPDCAYEQAGVILHPGDRLVIYTDGVSEAMNRALEEWGEDRLIAAVRSAENCSAAETILRIMQAADAFADGAPQHDDMTLVVMHVL